ncbi:MAG: helix-turn-helix domain-containing protein, partial [Clostridiales Family XIII bacterium]|nr:helix-turn-helix domain-containing protein [Clostridiales Family XIII bacterium]
IPHGAVSSKPQRKDPKTSYAQAILHGQEDEVQRYFEYIFAEFPDVLTMYDAAEMTGLAISTIQRLIKNGMIRSMRVDRRPMIPKAYMLDFVTGSKFLGIKSNSRDFHRVLRGFSVWKTQKS